MAAILFRFVDHPAFQRLELFLDRFIAESSACRDFSAFFPLEFEQPTRPSAPPFVHRHLNGESRFAGV
jgi:hypothetical protein